MIPLFAHGSHWITLVHREIDAKVYFFYDDDLNQRNTEDNIKNPIYHHTSHAFLPTRCPVDQLP